MRSLKNVVLLSALSLCVSAPAFAKSQTVDVKDIVEPTAQVTVLNADISSSVFEQKTKVGQVAKLSNIEMKETEGAWVPQVFGAGLGAIGYGASCSMTRSCTGAGFGFAAAGGAINPIRGAAAAVWGFNAAVGLGTINGVGSARRWW